MSRRGVLWIAFVVAHLGVALLGFLEPNMPMGDVYIVYDPWSSAALGGGGIVGVTDTWVYPALALVPMVLTHGFAWLGGYTIGWALLVTVCDLFAFWMLVGTGRSMGRTIAAWFWLAYIVLLGPVGMYRIDAVTVPIAIAGCLWLAGRPRAAAVLFTIGAWIKVWPAALFVAALVVVRQRLSVMAMGLVVTTAIIGIAALAGGAHVLGFVTEQTGRGLQIEAPVSTWWLWQAAFDPQRASIYYDTEILTFQVRGPLVEVVSALMTPLLAFAVAGVVVLGTVKAVRGAAYGRLLPPLSLALVLVFIVFNKVGSPQFHTWLIAPLVLAIVLNRHRAWPTAVLGLLCAGLTQLVYPMMYGEVLSADPVGLTVLTVRNVVLVVLLVVAVTQLARVPARRVAAAPTAASVPAEPRASTPSDLPSSAPAPPRESTPEL